MINDKPFYGFIAVGGKITLDAPALLKAWAKKIAGTTGAECVLFLADKAWLKTRQQEKGYHAMLKPLCLAKGFDIEDAKDYMLARVFGVDVSKIDGREILIEPHTSKLNKQQYSELIERTLEIAVTEFDVWLEAPSEWTTRKESDRRKTATRQARTEAA